MIPAEIVAKARDADFMETLEALDLKLKRVTSTERAGPCPVCNGDNRFGVNIRNRLWNCRGCGKGGSDALSLLMHGRGLDFISAVESLTGWKRDDDKDD